MANPLGVIRGLIGVQDSIGEFIRNGPDDGLPGYVRDEYRKRCDQFANLPGWAQALGNGTSGTMDRICSPYWDDNGWDGPEVAPAPFQGGQCDGELYLVTFGWTLISTGVRQTFPRTVYGPVGQPTIDSSGGGSVMSVTARGVRAAQSCSALPTLNPTSQEFTIVVSTGPANAPGVDSISKCSGTDNCGDPLPTEPIRPGPNPPPNPGPTTGPEPTTDPDNPTGAPLLPIPPYVDPIYGPTPIVAPTDGGGAGGTGGGDGLPGNPDAIADSAGGAGGGEDGEDIDFGEPPDGKIWVGALVQATVDSRLGNIPGTGPAQTVYPAVIGNASLIYTGGRGTNERLESSSTLLVRATTALVLTGCRAQAQPGVNLTVKPISATTCPDNPCEETDG